MTENLAIEAMHRALREARDARKRSESRLIDLESEVAMLRTQIASLDVVIEQTTGHYRVRQRRKRSVLVIVVNQGGLRRERSAL